MSCPSEASFDGKISIVVVEGCLFNLTLLRVMLYAQLWEATFTLKQTLAHYSCYTYKNRIYTSLRCLRESEVNRHQQENKSVHSRYISR